MSNLRAVCKGCMDAAIETWQRDYKDITLPKGTHLKIRLSGETPDGEPVNEYPWLLVTETSEEGEVLGFIDNDIHLLKHEYSYKDTLQVPRSLILNHVLPGSKFEDADREMEQRILSVHRH